MSASSLRGRTRRRACIPAAIAAAVLAAAATSACRPADARALSRAERTAIADSIAREVIAACDLRAPDVVARLMSLYPSSGPVISASGGHVTTTRDSLEASVRTFWNNVGHNMQDPMWQWTSMRIDVLDPNAAVMTATYRIPHRTPMGMPHVVGGAWTAVFERRAGRWVIIHEHLSDAANP
jgi:ketosteroid isomerase-like protein